MPVSSLSSSSLRGRPSYYGCSIHLQDQRLAETRIHFCGLAATSGLRRAPDYGWSAAHQRSAVGI